jgi:hypothetical protein
LNNVRWRITVSNRVAVRCKASVFEQIDPHERQILVVCSAVHSLATDYVFDATAANRRGKRSDPSSRVWVLP